MAHPHPALARAMNSPKIKPRLEAEGAAIIANTLELAPTMMRADLDEWAEVVKRTGIKAN